MLLGRAPFACRRRLLEERSILWLQPLDSEIEILDSHRKPIERAVIRAVSKTEMVLNDRDSATGALRPVAVGFGDQITIERQLGPSTISSC